MGRKHIYLPHAQTAIYDSKVKLFLKQGISHQLGQIKSNQKVLFKVGTFYNNQHKLSRAFQTDMHNKLHKLNTAQ